MMTTITTTLIAISLFAQAIVQDPNALPSKTDVLAAIDRFLATPGPSEDAKVINLYAEKSSEADCIVNITPEVLPWLTHQPRYKYHGALLTAFLAGNVKSQLTTGKAGDDPYAGVLAVIKAYVKLRERDAEFKAAEIEEYIAKEKSGELNAWVAERAKEAAAKHGQHQQEPPSTKKT